jgi:hypothetical protein
MPKASTSTNINSVQLKHQASDPATPSANYLQLYNKSKKVYTKDADGTVTLLTPTTPDWGTYLRSLVGGRLTLSSGVPVPATDLSAQGTLYYTPYIHNQISLYTTSVWTLYTFTERSLSLAGLSDATNYDIYLYDNGGTLTLEAVAWTNATTRATALAQQDGIYCKTGALDRRYLGTIRATAANQSSDSATARYVQNFYNSVPTAEFINGTTDITTTSDTYTSTGTTLGVLCIASPYVIVSADMNIYTDSGNSTMHQIDLDSTTQITNIWANGNASTAGTVGFGPLADGYHLFTLQWKRQSASGTAKNSPTTAAGKAFRHLSVLGLRR